MKCQQTSYNVIASMNLGYSLVGWVSLTLRKSWGSIVQSTIAQLAPPFCAVGMRRWTCVNGGWVLRHCLVSSCGHEFCTWVLRAFPHRKLVNQVVRHHVPAMIAPLGASNAVYLDSSASSYKAAAQVLRASIIAEDIASPCLQAFQLRHPYRQQGPKEARLRPASFAFFPQ